MPAPRNSWATTHGARRSLQHYWLYIMMLPALLYMIIFNYLPMTGLYMAFTDFSPFNGDTILECVFGSPFAG